IFSKHTALLVSRAWIEKLLEDPLLRIIVCRWILGKPGEGRRHYEEGHIPEAIHLDVDEQLSGKAGPGRHPIPRRADFERTMSEIGVGVDTYVIAYDAGNGMPAPRLWWLLRYFSHEKISVLDGGWKLWVKEGRRVAAGPSPRSSPVDGRVWIAGGRPGEGLVGKSYVTAQLNNSSITLIDARSPERYRGEIEPIDKRAGHIPGAINVPFTQCVDEEGRYRPPSYIKRGEIQETICYCGSGITACTDIFALKLAGIDAKLYEGSWSDWSNDIDLPIETK
ncbi:MAG: sulfurtransferase, partial [Deltaproteobacteria bacterium]|nr:sulfurtransferase [Deltaproteobacteria bacterium]